MGLKGRVLGGGVVEVDGSAVVGEDFPGGGVGYIDVAEVFAPSWRGS